jgi:hypothetical protein
VSQSEAIRGNVFPADFCAGVFRLASFCRAIGRAGIDCIEKAVKLRPKPFCDRVRWPSTPIAYQRGGLFPRLRENALITPAAQVSLDVT